MRSAMRTAPGPCSGPVWAGVRGEADGPALEGLPGGVAAPGEAPDGGGGSRAPGHDVGIEAAGEGPEVARQKVRAVSTGAFPTARPGGRMRRLPGGRKRVVFVRLSPEEEAWIVPKATAEGLSVQRFLVESAMPEGRASLLARRALYREFFAARRDLHGACTNLNQLAHLGNQRREVPTGVEDCVDEVEAAMGRLVNLASLLMAHPKVSPGGGDESVEQP